MKKFFSIILVILMMVISFSACASKPEAEVPATEEAVAEGVEESVAEASGEPTYVLKMGHAMSNTDDFHLAAQMMADLVLERTNGDVKIEIYPGAQLGSTAEQAEAVVNGYQDLTGDAINILDGYVPLADIESYPFLFNSPEECVAFIESDLCDELMNEIGGEQFVILGVQYRGARMLQTTKPVHNLEDLKNLKLRTATMPILNYPWEVLGCATTTMNFNDIYTGLQQGTIDGQENPLQQSWASGFAEIEKYIMNTEHVHGYMGYFFSKKVFDSLPAEYQTIIREASDESAQWRTQKQMESQEEYLQRFLDAGLEYIEVEDMDQWKAALEEPLKAEFANLQDWVAKIQNFTNENKA